MAPCRAGCGSPTPPRQRRALRSTYAGWNPRTYGRYGRHQWRAALPGTRVVVKDPFAMLSAPTIVAVTGARPIQVYRHPGAVLASYRRMGWRPDLDEIADLVPVAADHRPELAALWATGAEAMSEAARMALFWAVLQQLVLDDLPRAPGTVLVPHADLAGGGLPAVRALFAELGLEPTDDTARVMSGGDRPAPTSGSELHRLDRRPEEVAESWRRHLEPAEVAEIEELAGPVLAELDAGRLVW
ncbi:MAG: hypothetical protein R2734_14500 [Nocardioides sp.]